MRRNPGILPLVLGCLLLPAAPSAAEPPLAPPLAGTPRLTSSFAEYRSGHYHGGLDYSTGGREGLPVVLPAAGSIGRVRASGTGYGRALYVDLDDGRTLVFAHLSRFAPPVEAALRDEQDARGGYDVDFRPARGSLRLAAGDTVAWTGGTGSGPPHLHAEIRRGDRALDPQAHGWSVADRRAPLLDRLLLVPASPNSLIDGSLEPVVHPLEEGRVDTITVQGPVRLRVRTTDRADAGDNVLATHRVTALLDGAPWRSLVLDAFDWNHPGEVEWTFDEARARVGERWMRLDPPPGSRQSIHRAQGPLLGAGLPGTRRLRLEARDVAGNATVRDVVVRVAPPPLRSPVPEGAPGWTAHGDLLVGRAPARSGGALRLVDPEGVPVPPVRRDRSSGRVLAAWSGERLAPGAYRLGTGAGDAAREAVLTAASGDTLRLSRDGVRLSVPPGAGYGPVWILVHPTTGAAADPREPELDPVGAGVELGPWAAPFRRRVRVGVDLPRGEASGGVGLYVRTARGWSPAGHEQRDGAVWGTVGNAETLALFRDRIPPAIAVLRPAGGDTVDAAPRIEVRVSETGSGVSASRLALRLDGDPVIAEWDPEARLYRAHLRGPLSPGVHRARVEARDAAGNRAHASWTFHVR